MARKETEPLTPQEAKQQLRYVALRFGLAPWVRRQPIGAVLAGLLGGFILGRAPRSLGRLSNTKMAQKMIDRLV